MKRFQGIQRLYGSSALEKLSKSHIAIVGVGGVGSWAAEALARSGVGKITLVDLDDICESNINRQIHALTDTIGQSKVMALKKRIELINPECEVCAIQDFYTKESAEQILSLNYDYVFDAIDTLKHKIQLFIDCKKRNIPLLIGGVIGGKKDATKIEIKDLAHSSNDKLLKRLKHHLRRKHGEPVDPAPLGYSAIYVAENHSIPEEFVRINNNGRLDCEGGLGNASYIAGSMGLTAAGYIINQLSH